MLAEPGASSMRASVSMCKSSTTRCRTTAGSVSEGSCVRSEVRALSRAAFSRFLSRGREGVPGLVQGRVQGWCGTPLCLLWRGLG